MLKKPLCNYFQKLADEQCTKRSLVNGVAGMLITITALIAVGVVAYYLNLLFYDTPQSWIDRMEAK